MHKRALSKWPCIALGVAMGLAVLGAGARPAAADQTASDLFAQGMRDFQNGKYAEAGQAFQTVMAMKPGSKEARKMFDLADLSLLMKMHEVDELADAASLLMKLRRAALQQGMRDVVDVDKILDDYRRGDLTAYLNARAAVLGHGPYAVPYMLELLAAKGKGHEVGLTRAVATLAEMRHDICMPLLASLDTDDDLLRIRLCSLLGQVGDRRAVPRLLALAQDVRASEPVAKEAAQAIRSITDSAPEQMGAAPQQYEKLMALYMQEDATAVGYTFGDSTEIWLWDQNAPAGQPKLTYELVPGYLYYQRQGTQLALQALALDPANETVQGMLLTLLVRQLKLVSAAAEGGMGVEATAEANYRMAKLASDVPVACRIYSADVVGRAIENAVDLGDGTSALYLVRQIADKVGADEGVAARALEKALKMTDKDVRYYTAVAIMKLSPAGELGDPRRVVRVMAATLRYTTARTALLVFNNLQLRNRLAAVLRELGLGTVEGNMSAGTIEKVLAVEPAIDVMFVDGNVPGAGMKDVMTKLAEDSRTRAVPLYVIVDPRRDAADLAGYGAITAVMSPDHVRTVELESVVKPAFAKRPSPFAVARGELVLLAAQTLLGVDPATTKYPLGILEPSLASALDGYGLPVQMATVANLTRFGTEVSVAALTRAVVADQTPELTSAACYALAAIAGRCGKPLPDSTMQALREPLVSEVETVRQAAAEALSAGGLSAEDVRPLVSDYADPKMAAMPAVTAADRIEEPEAPEEPGTAEPEAPAEEPVDEGPIDLF